MSTHSEHKHTNQLINATSPYLLQHAHNPVDWYPWGEEAFEKAKQEDKLVLISIGYSACHWCHVMERESFENEEIAALMNEKFVCIKVDREERPDVDQIYMTAVQLMQQRGGWPLNCFTLPDGRPMYGGTYFPPDSWKDLLNQLHNVYETDSMKVIEYADNLTNGIQQSELLPKVEGEVAFEPSQLANMVDQWKSGFDNKEGGPNRAPKFPLPNNYQFLLEYYHHTKDEQLLEHIELTLDKMAYGGIYDQVGGGFARYSTDVLWKVPHFEKMLYDNAQLVSLYAEAYQATGKMLYKQVVYETLEYIAREMTAKEGAFYSALDADSEGEEGKFYVWSEEELKTLLGDDFEVTKDYYNVNAKGKWEGHYILLRKDSNEEVAQKHGLTTDELAQKITSIKATLLKARESRIRPGLDDKSLTSWNALMLKGYVDAYQVFDEQAFLDAAEKSAQFILHQQRRTDGGLNHSYKAGKSTINGYLEDYCFTIEALIALYEATFDEKWLYEAKQLADYTIDHFYDEATGLFYFTSDVDPPLIARKTEVSDNVIPASNSSMAKGLSLLGHYFDNERYNAIAQQMLKNIYQYMPNYGSGYSNWGLLAMQYTYPFYEVAITGKEVHDRRKELNAYYVPNKMLIGSIKESKLPLLEMKLMKGQTTIYVCQNKVCQLPVTAISEALKQMK